MAMGQMQKTIKVTVKTTQKLWPYQVVNDIQKVMEEGKIKYPDDEWKGQSVMVHLAHAKDHIMACVNGKKDDDHLAHAFTRLMMAIAIERGYMDEEEDDFL